MPKLEMTIPHKLSQEEALKRIKTLLGEVKKQFANKISNLLEEWGGNVGKFSFSTLGFNVSGRLIVSQSQIELLGNIPFAAVLLKGKIESVIRERANALLTNASRAGSPPTPTPSPTPAGGTGPTPPTPPAPPTSSAGGAGTGSGAPPTPPSTNNDDEHELNPFKNIATKQFVLWTLAGYAIAFVVLYILLAFVFGIKMNISNLFGTHASWSWNLAILMLLLSHAVLSIKIVGDKEQAVKVFLGKPIQDVSSGPVFVPFLLCKLQRYTRNLIYLEIGLPQKAGESQEIPIPTPPLPDEEDILRLRASSQPLRINFGSYEAMREQLTPDEQRIFTKEDHLNRRMTADPLIVVLFRIVSPGQFTTAMGGLTNALGAIEEAVMGALQEYCGKITPAYFTHNLSKVNKALRENIEVLVGDPDAKERWDKLKEQLPPDQINDRQNEKPHMQWGVDLKMALVKSPGIPKAVNVAIAAARAAGFNKEAIITTAEAEKEKRILEGEGKGSAIKAEKEGEAAGIFAILKQTARGRRLIKMAAAGNLGQLIAYLESQKTVAENAKYIIASDGNLMGLLARGKETLEQIPATELRPRARRLAGLIFDVSNFNYAPRGIRTKE